MDDGKEEEEEVAASVSISIAHGLQKEKHTPLKKQMKREFRKACLDDDDVFEVEKIVGLTKVDGKTLYRVRWSGYTAQCDTWEPYDNLLTCKDLVDEYIERECQRKKRKAMNSSTVSRKLSKKRILPQFLERERDLLVGPGFSPNKEIVTGSGSSSCYHSAFEATARLIETERRKLHAEQQVTLDVRGSGVNVGEGPNTKARARCTLRGRGGGRMSVGRSGNCRGRSRLSATESHVSKGSSTTHHPDCDLASSQRTSLGSKTYTERTEADTELIGEPRVARSTPTAAVTKHHLPQSGGWPGTSRVKNENVELGATSMTVTPPPPLGAANRPATAVDSVPEKSLGADSVNDGSVAVTRAASPVILGYSRAVTSKLPSGGWLAVLPKAFIEPVPPFLAKQFVGLCGGAGVPRRSVQMENAAVVSKEVTNDDVKHAVKMGDYKMVMLAFKDGCKKYDVEQRNASGTTLLMMACVAGYDDVAQLLIANGADPNARHGSGSTPLMFACEGGRLRTVNVLLLAGALMELCDENGETALIKACSRGHQSIVRLLLARGANFARVPKDSIDLSIEVLHCLNDHIARVTSEFDAVVGVTLKRTAKIVQSLFPLHCFSLNEATGFDIQFEHRLSDASKEPGVGMLLFIAHAFFSDDGIHCRLYGRCVVRSVTLNGIKQPSLTENANFILSFSPVIVGRNNLNIKTERSESEVKLLVCAYKARLLASNELC